MWSSAYEEMVNRNLGLLTRDDQDKLKNAKVALCGLGGLGGPVAEMLARTGIENFVLLDNGQFEASNLNRQIFCFEDTLGQYKTDVTEIYLKKINSAIRTQKYRDVNQANVDKIISGCDAVALTIDTTIPVLLLAQASRKAKIPLVEGWALPFGNVRVYTDKTVSLEEAYGIDLKGKSIEQLSEEEARMISFQSVFSLVQKVDGAIEKYYTEELAERYRTSLRTSTLAPLVWVTCSFMATEIIKLILGWGPIALAPDVQVYDSLTLEKRAYSKSL